MSPLDDWQIRAEDTDPPSLPEPLTRSEFEALSQLEQKTWLKQRKESLALPWPTIITPQVGSILDELEQSFESRDRKIGALNGFILDGDSGIGKTTLIDLWARETHRKLVERNPDCVGQEFSTYAPVVTVNLPEKPTPTTILRRINDFIGIPYTKGLGTDRLKSATFNHLKQLGTEVLIFDEIQHIEFSGRKTTPAAIACLKDIGNELDVYMVFAGSNLKHSQLLSPNTQEGTSPFAARFQTEELLPVVSPAVASTWASVVKATERNLRLIDHDHQLHVHSADLLWDRCSGRIRTLIDLLRKANYRAVASGGEKLGTELLRATKADALSLRAV